MKPNIVVVDAPAFEPVSLADARSWVGVEADDTEHTIKLSMLIAAARMHAENLTRRAFIQRTLRAEFDGWPCGRPIQLPFPPMASVQSVKYRDTSGDLQTLDPALYEVHGGDLSLVVAPVGGAVWPSACSAPNAIQVTYIAGYDAAEASPLDEAAAQANIPDALKLWMQTRVATLFEQREQFAIGISIATLPHDYVDGLLDPLIAAERLF